LKTASARVFLAIGLSALLLSGCAIKPEPFSEEEHRRTALEAKSTLYQNQSPLDSPLSLPLAVARALTYNYDHRLAAMDAVFQSREMTAATLGMLPKLTASAGYTSRDNESASRSISYYTRKQTLEPSVSQERQRVIADLSFSWSILDFGLSYFQAKQYADRYLIMEERRRRVVNNIVKDVVTTYWSVTMAEALLPQVRAALEDTEKALASYNRARSSGLAPLVESLDEEKRLLQISGGLKRLAADLAQSKIHLAALVNIPMDEPYSIVMPERAYMHPPALPKSIVAAEDVALYMRPDLREDSYQERIDKNELNKEILRMIPGISLVVSTNYDSNTYLHHNIWTEGTARITSNLIGLFGNYHQYRAANTQIEVTRTRKLANMIAALVQVRLAYHQYAIALQDYRDSVAMYDLEQRIYKIVRAESRDGSISDLERINRYTDLIAADLTAFQALRAVYEAWGNFYFSLGGDLVQSFPENAALEEKAALVQSGLERWWAGDLPAPPSPEPARQIQADPEPAGERFDYVHQVAAFKHSASAERLRARLTAAGITAQAGKSGAWHTTLVRSRGGPDDIDTLRARLVPFGIKQIILRSKTPVTL
jgi:outer membrane protein TolC